LLKKLKLVNFHKKFFFGEKKEKRYIDAYMLDPIASEPAAFNSSHWKKQPPEFSCCRRMN